MSNMKRPNVSDRVSGLYFDQPFTGIVTAVRVNSYNWASYQTTIVSDQDIVVAGKPKRCFLIESQAAPGERDAYGCMIEVAS